MHKFKLDSENLEQYFLDLMAGKRRAWYDRAMIGLLFIFSRFYLAAVRIRRWLYDNGVLKTHALGCLVISVGNLSCGGTGKTPVVELIARSQSQLGRKVAILSRGYRRKEHTWREKFRGFFHPAGKKRPPVSQLINVSACIREGGIDSMYAGDEPYMLAKNLPDVTVLVDKNRVEAGIEAQVGCDADMLILDDGFQYLKLKPHLDKNIVLVDSSDPFGNGFILPRGTLREPITNICRADYIFLTKSDGSPKLKHLKRFLRHHAPFAGIFECCHRPQYLVPLPHGSAEKIPLSALRGSRTAALSAIAKPESFECFLTDFGAELVFKDHFADHHRYTEEEIREFIRQSRDAGATMIVTTEKDAVRIPPIPDSPLPLYYLRIEIDFLTEKDRDAFNRSINRINANEFSRRKE